MNRGRLHGKPRPGTLQEGILEGWRGIRKAQWPGEWWVKVCLAGWWATGVKAPKICWSETLESLQCRGEEYLIYPISTEEVLKICCFCVVVTCLLACL